jgi:hypothetical protein
MESLFVGRSTPLQPRPTPPARPNAMWDEPPPQRGPASHGGQWKRDSRRTSGQSRPHGRGGDRQRTKPSCLPSSARQRRASGRDHQKAPSYAGPSGVGKYLARSFQLTLSPSPYGWSQDPPRGMLERALARRWLGPAIAMALVLLVLLIGLHVVADEFVEEAALVCAVSALAGLIVIPLAGERSGRLPPRQPRKRSSPVAASRAPALSLRNDQRSFPLRRSRTGMRPRTTGPPTGTRDPHCPGTR